MSNNTEQQEAHIEETVRNAYHLGAVAALEVYRDSISATLVETGVAMTNELFAVTINHAIEQYKEGL